MRYILFTKKSCPFCTKAVDFLEQTKADYSEVVFDQDQEQKVLQEIKDAYEWSTVPMIFSREGNSIKFIGGYTDLVELFIDEQ
jgi:glutaredoxin